MITIGDTMPAIADRDGYAMAAQRAWRLFKTEEMQEAGKFMAVVHTRAIDYLEQAPVLAIFVKTGGGKLNGGQGGAAIYAAHKIGQLAERGARLRDVMTAYALPLPLRQLKGKALGMEDQQAIQAIAALPPSVISQAIPTSIAAQRRWLSVVREWLKQARRHAYRERHKIATEWLIVQASRHGIQSKDLGTVADFLLLGDVPLNPAWEWRRAVAATEDWHDRLSAGDAKKKFGIMADQIIDRGTHPDLCVVDGYEFVALRTPLAIHAEGSAMRHCVASYVNSVMAGRCSIISVRQDEQRVATMELEPRGGGLVRQLKGRFNATPDMDVQTAARHYAFALRKAAAA